MKKLDLYILRKYLVTFLVAMALIIVIIITFDVSEKLDDFLSGHAPLREVVFQYYLNFIPGFVSMYSPLFIFISVIFFTSKLAGNTEVIAILGSGVSYRRMLRPYMEGAALVAVAVLVLGNLVIPLSNERLSVFEKKYIKTNQRTFYSHVHFQSSRHDQVYCESFDVARQSATRFCMDTYDEGGTMVRRQVAMQLTYDTVDGQWLAAEYFDRRMEGERERLEFSPSAKLALDLTPVDFKEYAINITTLGTPRLVRHIERERMRGSGVVTFAKIELWQRLLNPLAILVMTLIGVSISSRKTRGGIGMHLAIGIVIAFAFIVFMKVTTVFATNGNLPPFMAVLLPQIVFGVAAVYLMRTAPK